MNSVQFLLEKPFSLCSLEEKSEIKRLGRATPVLDITQCVKTKTRSFNRKFNPDFYEKFQWLCGCPQRKSFFCFPCILFGGEEVWTKQGVSDIQHLQDRSRKHESSKIHKTNALKLAMFGNINVVQQIDGAYRRSIECHNEKVTQNRYVLNIIINCIRFCGSFELALRGHDESDTSENPGIFRGLINFSAELDSAMKAHIDTATVFRGTSKTIQNELLQCMLEVCQEEISKEIKESNFVAIMADETSDVSLKNQLVIIFRYLVNLQPVERFWSFVIPESQNAVSLASCISREIGRHLEDSPEKLIAQTYDGAAVMAGTKGGVQAIIKKKYVSAEYVHCHAHQLNLIMLNAASINRSVRVFFVNLQGICTFFSNSPQRTSILDEVVGKRLPRSVPTRWNFQSRSVNTIHEYRLELIECMETILTGERVTNATTILQASGFKSILSEETFIYWLAFFHKTMPYVDILFNQLQRRDTNPTLVQSHLEAFEREMTKIRENVCIESSDGDMTKRRRVETHKDRRREACEVCDVIITEMKERFSFKGHLAAAALFRHEKFAVYEQNFPEESLRNVIKAYPFLNEKNIRTELVVIYGTDEFKSISGALSLMEFIRDNNLGTTFSESSKLLQVLLTIPMTSSEAERCFSTLKRVKTFLRSTMAEDRLSALAMLSIERNFIMRVGDFNQRVIEKFARGKERRADFLYK